MTLELYPYGDTELFYASGQDGSWSLPLYVQWRQDADGKHYGLVMPAVGLYYSQGLALIALLQMHDIQGRQDQWLIPRTMVEALLHKAPGITELAYYKWPEPDMPAIQLPKVLRIDKVSGITTESAMNSPTQDPFVAFLSEKTKLQRSIIRVVLKAISEEAPRWMLENRRALDLGFCRLIAAPFRPNWKEIVGFKFKKWKLLELFGLPQRQRRDALDDAGLPAAMCSMHNIAIRKMGQRHRLEYTLEAIPSKRFTKEVESVERKRIACGGTSYVASFEKTVEALYHHLLDALEAYLHKTSLPFARLFESGQRGELRLLPTTAQQIKVRGVGIRDIPTHILSARSPFSLLAEQSDQLLVQAQAPPMPKMPDLLQAADDLRQPTQQGDVVEQGSAGASRVPVLAAGKNENEGQPMLSRLTLGTGDSSGVDGR